MNPTTARQKNQPPPQGHLHVRRLSRPPPPRHPQNQQRMPRPHHRHPCRRNHHCARSPQCPPWCREQFTLSSDPCMGPGGSSQDKPEMIAKAEASVEDEINKLVHAFKAIEEVSITDVPRGTKIFNSVMPVCCKGDANNNLDKVKARLRFSGKESQPDVHFNPTSSSYMPAYGTLRMSLAKFAHWGTPMRSGDAPSACLHTPTDRDNLHTNRQRQPVHEATVVHAALRRQGEADSLPPQSQGAWHHSGQRIIRTQTGRGDGRSWFRPVPGTRKSPLEGRGHHEGDPRARPR